MGFSSRSAHVESRADGAKREHRRANQQELELWVQEELDRVAAAEEGKERDGRRVHYRLHARPLCQHSKLVQGGDLLLVIAHNPNTRTLADSALERD